MNHSRFSVIRIALLFAVLFFGFASAAQADRTFSLKYSVNDTGSLHGIGNSSMTCKTSDSGCSTARNAGVTVTADSSLNNDNWNMQWIDADSDASTFNSTSADQSIPAGSTILYAALYWGGRNPGNSERRDQVKFKLPGSSSYQTVTASTVDTINSGGNAGIYQSFADVTNLVQPLPNGGNGTYWVADIKGSTGKTMVGGWSLIVAYRNPNESMKNMTIFDGLVNVGTNETKSITVSGFQTPPSGPVNAKAGFVTWEGDLGIVGDRAKLNGQTLSDAQHPATNFFDARFSHDGVMDSARNPAYSNNFGFEAAWLAPPANAVQNGDTSATIEVTTSGDNFVPGVIAFQTEIYSPKVEQAKSATDVNGGQLEQGDVITYRITGKNTGQDGTANFVLRDSIPANTTYVPGSINIVKSGGAPTGSRTDASGDDTAEYDSINDRIIARLGTGSNASIGGNIGPGKEYEVTFQVRVNGPDVNPVPDLTVIDNEAVATLTAQSSSLTITSEADTQVTVKSPDLRILKTRTGADFVAGGTSQYTLKVDNHGSANTQGQVTVSDPLANGLTATAVNAPGWNCNTLPSDHLTCTRSDALAPGGNYPDIVVTVAIGDDVTDEVENISTVSGGGDSKLGDNTSSSTNPVSRKADLAITKTASKHQVKIGDTFTYALTVTNNGPSKATSTTITDEIPDGLSFVSADPGCTFEPLNGTVVCAIGTLASGASTTINVTVKVDGDAHGQIENTASVTSQQEDPNPDNNTDTETVDATGADLQVTKSVKSPSVVKTGDTVVYEVVVRNNGPSGATGVVLTDALPAGLTNVTTNNNACTVSVPTINCALGNLASGDSVTIEVSGKVKPGQTTLVNNASATGNEFDPDPTNNQDSVETPVTPQVDLKIVKTASVSQIVPGGNFTYTFSVTNNGPDAGTGVTVTDTLPSGISFVSSGDCSAAGQDLTCAVGALAAGQSKTLTVTVKAANSVTGDVVNTANVTGNQPDPNPNDNTSTVTTPTQIKADLGVVKTKLSPAEVKTGDTVTWQIVATNHGPSNATGVVVTDTLPSGVTDVTTDNNACTVSVPTINCAVGNLANGASVTIKVTAKVKPGQSNLINTAKVKGDQPDPNPGNDTSTTNDPVSPVADLGIVKQADRSSVEAGQNLVYTFKVTNYGPDSVTGATITDTLPAGVTYVDGAPGCNASGQVVTCTINFLAAGGSAQTGITVKVTDSAANPVRNTAKVTGSPHDPNPGNNTSTIETPVTPPAKDADVAIVKTADNHNPQAGDVVTYTLTTKNNGPAAAENVVVTDELPDGVTFVSADAPCTESGGKITCALGTLAPGQEVALKVRVRINPWSVSPSTGTHGIDVQKVETQIDLDPGQTRTVTAECPSGYFVSDGSVRIDHIDQGTGSWTAPQVTESRASDNRTWQGTVTNTASGRAQAKIFAVCIRETTNPDGHGHNLQVSAPVVKTIALEPGSNEATLECPAGTVAIQPGFIADSPGHLVYSQPEGNGWKFIYKTAVNQASDQISYSIRCFNRSLTITDGHSHNLSLQRIWTEQVIQPGQVHEVQLTCPDGSKGIVAGWDLDDGLVSLGNDPRPVTRAFKVYNPTDKPLKARFSLLCLGNITSDGGGAGSKDITNTAKVKTSTTETDPGNNSSSVTITAGTSGSGPIPDGNGKPPVNNPTDRDTDRPGVVSFRATGKLILRGGTVNLNLKSSGKTHGRIKLITTRRHRVGGKKISRGTVLARGGFAFKRAGAKKVRLRTTALGRKVLGKGSIRKVRVVVIGGGPSRVVGIGR
ncbi:MAG: DUF11 domain-containing protein [Solirubrobacterales bacterium]|nr:DUF11 domain-containing protein [Solirubrobacterales bacterium]